MCETCISKDLDLRKLWLRISNKGEQQMKVTKHTLEHIELIETGETALFEVNLIVAMHDWDEETDEDMGALSWLLNLLTLAAAGHDIKYGAAEFLKATMTLSETRVHLCKVEKITA
jgi:hypothetical protein